MLCIDLRVLERVIELLSGVAMGVLLLKWSYMQQLIA